MPKRPVSLKIAGRRWRIASRDLSAEHALGLSHGDQGLIEISTAHDDLFNEQDTLLHEVLHSILRQQGRTYTRAEEVYVTAIATGLLGVLHDNPALAAYLIAKP